MPSSVTVALVFAARATASLATLDAALELLEISRIDESISPVLADTVRTSVLADTVRTFVLTSSAAADTDSA
ncbi:MAG: hypothetical protein M3P91_12440 [Actinomycetota bacterium]|nr:hypothetical protein [Actinomycetota bacterium]